MGWLILSMLAMVFVATFVTTWLIRGRGLSELLGLFGRGRGAGKPPGPGDVS